MRLLVFLALMSVCRCFQPPLETTNERYGLPPQYIFSKDEYLQQIGPNVPVSYANPFSQYQYTYVPISHRYPQYYNAIGQYDSLPKPSSPLPTDISISNNNDAFAQKAQIFPHVLGSKRNIFKGSSPILGSERRGIDDIKVKEPEIPITLSNTRKNGWSGGNRYLQAILSMNNETPGTRNIGQTDTYLDLINQILKGSVPIVSINQQNDRVTNVPLPYMPFIMGRDYDNIKIQKDADEILNYVVSLMLSEKHLNPGVVQVLSYAKNIDFSKLDEIDETQLVKLSFQDTYYLKQYLIRIINAYGLTTYTFKLLEYIYLIEGIPKIEIHLILKILANDGAPQNFDKIELQQLKRHLLRIYEDYNESPYILAFLKYVLETQFSPTENVNLPIVNIDYGENHIKNEEQEIISFVVRIMISENNISPAIIKVLNSALNIDFSKLDILDETLLVEVSNEDVERLKKYLIQVINLYGLTAYSFRLLEYTYLLEGRPKIEAYLMSLILADNTAANNFNENELKLIKEHLLRIYRDYNESPYILAFLKNILNNQFKPMENHDSDIKDFNFYDVINDVQQIDMQKIYLYLSQMYNTNPNVLKILKIINDIYGYVESDIPLPVINQSDLQSLTTLRPEDLNLLVKYILQVLSQRGNNIYFNGLLSYINWIQISKREPIDVSITNHNNTVFNETEEIVDLSPIYKYLSELNSSKSNKMILVILNHLLQNQSFPVTTLNSIETLGYGDLVRIKEFLLLNEGTKLSPTIQNFVKKLDQAIQKQEVAVILEGDHNFVKIIPEDLELLKQYMISKKTSVPDYYLNEILQVIKQAQNKHFENAAKLKYFDLLQIYKYLLQTQGRDINNPVLVKVQQYVNENNNDINIQKDSNYKKPDVNVSVTNNIVNGSQISLDEVYKYLIHKSLEDNSNPLLSELLKYFNKTIILPNGELKIKIISANSTKPTEQISQQDLEKLLLYLVNVKENSETENNYLYTELLKYLKKKSPKEDYEVATNPLYIIPIDALYRIKQFLQKNIKDYGKNDYVYQIILKINEILKSRQIDDNIQIIDNLNINEDDLKILLQYLTKYVNVPDPNNDIFKLVKYIIKSENDMKYQGDYEKNQEYLNLILIKLLKNYDIKPAIKDILQFIMIDKKYEDPNLLIMQLKESHKLDKLNTIEIIDLIKYLQQIKTTTGANEAFGILIDNIIRLQNEIELNKKVTGNGKESKKDLKFSRENVKIINKYLMDLFDEYGKDENVVHIIYKINHVKDGSDENKDLTKLTLNFNNEELILNVDDLRSITRDLINLIDHHGLNQELMKMLRVIFSYSMPPVKDRKISILGVNDTHVEVAIDQKNLDQVQRYINTIAKYYKLHPDKLNILPIVYPIENLLSDQVRNNTKLDKSYTLVIRHGELKLFTKYILELIKRHGMIPELINVLLFVCDIYGDNTMAMKEQNQMKANDLVVSEEMKALLQQGVEQNIQNMNTVSLKNLYMQLIQKLFASPNNWPKAKMNQVISILLNMYNREVTPVNKYILLKLFNYLNNNKETNYEALWQPDFVLLLMDLKNEGSTVPPNRVHNIPNNGHREYIVIQPYDYKNDIEGSLTKLITKLYQPINTHEKNKKVVTNNNITKEKVEKILKPFDSNKLNKNIVSNYTIYKVSEDEFLEGRQPKIKVEEMHIPINTTEQNKNTMVNYTIYKVSEDKIQGSTKPKIKVKEMRIPINSNEQNKNTMVNYTIYKVSEDEIQGSTKPKIKVKEMRIPINTNEQNKNTMVNYTIYKVSEDEIQGSTKPKIKVNEMRIPINTNIRNKNTMVNYTIYKVSEDEIQGSTKPKIKVKEMRIPINTNEQNKNIMVNYAIYKNDKEGSRRKIHPNIKVEETYKPINTNEYNKNIVANFTVYESSDNGSRREIQPNIKAETMTQPIDMKEKKINVVANYKIAENNDIEVRGRTIPNLKVEVTHKPINTNERNNTFMNNYTVSEINENGIHRRTLPEIKVEEIYKPINTNELDKHIVANYTIYTISKDGSRRQTQPNIKIENITEPIDMKEKNINIVASQKTDGNTDNEIYVLTLPDIKEKEMHKPINTSEQNKHIVANYTVYKVSEDRSHGRTLPEIKVEEMHKPVNTNEQNNNIVTNYTVSEINEDGIHKQTLPEIKVKETHKPISTNELNKHIVANYTIYTISKDGNRRQTQPNVKVENITQPIDMKEKNINIVDSYKMDGISDNEIRVLTLPDIKEEEIYKPIDTNEQNKSIVTNYTINGISEDGIRGQTQTNIKIERNYKPIDTNGKNKNIVVNKTVYEMNTGKNSGRTQPNLKEVSCEKANKKFNLILTRLQDASSSNQEEIDLSIEEFLKLYDILDNFKKRLSFENHNEIVPSSVLIRELEQRLLQNDKITCEYPSNIIVNTLISDLVSVLRQVIQYMKSNGYDDKRMKAIVVSLVNRLMPDINAIAVKGCEIKTPKELLSTLFSKVYASENTEDEEVQFAAGYTLHGDTDEDFLHMLSMQKLLQEIVKYKKL